MHEAICASCGKTCEVPFRPTGEKPVYCDDCFAAQGGRSNRRPTYNRGGGHGSDLSQAIAQVNAKLDKIMAALKIENTEPEPEPQSEAEPATETDAYDMVDDLVDAE
jgi:CxxC-x17-CxxC domain-containing protein